MTVTLRRIFVSATCLLACGSAALRADSITLRSGATLTGIVKQLEGGYELTTVDGKKQFIPSEEVKSLKLSNEGKVTEGSARERLASLQRSVESERDLPRIIERYEQFVQMNANTDAAKQAQADLDEWRGRREQAMVKVGHRWLTPAERDADLMATAKTVDQLCTMFAAQQYDAANAILRKGLDDNPENVSFQYLAGVMQMLRGQAIDARRSFEMVTQQVPDHVPTIINQAVLAVGFKRWPQAVGFLEQSMTLAPGVQDVLDNVLEFSNLAPDATRRTGTFERMMKRYAEQEASLEARMAQRGLFRWGSRWVDQPTLDQAKKDQDAYEKKKKDMQADFDDTQARAAKADEQVQMIERLLQNIEAGSVTVDPITGRAIRRAYPSAYYDLQRDLDRAKQEKAGYDQHAADLKKQARDVEASAPKPPFAGKLTPVGERGVPVVLPAASTRPVAPANAVPRTPATTPASRGPGPWRVPTTQP